MLEGHNCCAENSECCAISPENLPAWVAEMFHRIDKKDINFTVVLSEDCYWEFAGQGVKGLQEIRKAFTGLFQGLPGEIKHEISRAWHCKNSVILEGKIYFTLKDKSKISIPFVDLLDTKEEKICSFKIYMDSLPFSQVLASSK